MHHDTGPGVTPDEEPQETNGAASDAPRAAAQLLAMAARDAEQWVSEAKGEAATLVEQATAEAARLVQAGRDEAERLTTTAQDEAEAVTTNAHDEAARVRAELEAAKHHHEAEVAELQRLASEYRERLRRHLTDLLQQLDHPPPAAADEATEPDVVE